MSNSRRVGARPCLHRQLRSIESPTRVASQATALCNCLLCCPIQSSFDDVTCPGTKLLQLGAVLLQCSPLPDTLQLLTLATLATRGMSCPSKLKSCNPCLRFWLLSASSPVRPSVSSSVMAFSSSQSAPHCLTPPENKLGREPTEKGRVLDDPAHKSPPDGDKGGVQPAHVRASQDGNESYRNSASAASERSRQSICAPRRIPMSIRPRLNVVLVSRSFRVFPSLSSRLTPLRPCNIQRTQENDPKET